MLWLPLNLICCAPSRSTAFRMFIFVAPRQLNSICNDRLRIPRFHNIVAETRTLVAEL
jgi:hypothetical protein